MLIYSLRVIEEYAECLFSMRPVKINNVCVEETVLRQNVASHNVYVT
jgi:hypothetical protein